MINYPNKKKSTVALKSKEVVDCYKNRGMNFEGEINSSNEYYRQNKIANIHKKPTPIKIVKIQNNKERTGKIEEAYFERASTTDYNGIYQGKYIDFEAKETQNKTSFPKGNIHLHQLEHLKSIIEMGGIGFLLIYFKHHHEVYLLDGMYAYQYFVTENHASIPYEKIKEFGHLVNQGYLVTIDYLKTVDKVYLAKKDI